MDTLRNLRHRLAHALGVNRGRPEIWRARCGKLMAGFRYHGCAQLTAVHPAREAPAFRAARRKPPR